MNPWDPGGKSPRLWVAKPCLQPTIRTPSTHLPCRRRRAFFSRTHSRLFLTTPRLAILYGTLWGNTAVSKRTGQPSQHLGEAGQRNAASLPPGRWPLRSPLWTAPSWGHLLGPEQLLSRRRGSPSFTDILQTGNHVLICTS